MFLKVRSVKDVFLHLLIMLVLFVAAVLFFFYGYLPWTTNHGETITVPNLTGKTLSEIEGELTSKNLRYQVNDSSYVPEKKPFTILAQHPAEGSHVKEHRKIYLSISSLNPPKIKMPALIDGSLKNAEISLKGYGLQLGHVKSVPSPYLNLVVDQSVNGQTIKPGTYISKGTKVDLSVGDGSKGVDAEVPNLIGMNVDEAKEALQKIGLDLGLVEPDNNSNLSSGTITKQSPSKGNTLKTGDLVEVWIAH
jgi:beta-lactam-binding protein with PASTA domain